MKKCLSKVNRLVCSLDEKPLWGLGFVLTFLVFLPYLQMGEKSVFPWHDQMDENILNYVFTAKHLGEGLQIFPEMMNGVNASSLQPFAVLFVPLYKIFEPFIAFVLQYVIVFIIAFFGMYFLVKELVKSNLIALIISGCFSMLPFYPVYGASVAGIPLCILGIWLLEKKKRVAVGYLCIFVYALTSHVVFSGYAVCIIWAIVLTRAFLQKKLSRPSVIGFGLYCALVCVINYQLIFELVFHTDNYVSHRTEFVSYGMPVTEAVKTILWGHMEHAEANQRYLVLPILVMLLTGLLFVFKRKEEKEFVGKALWGGLTIVCVSALYCFFKSSFYINIKNNSNGILHYFQVDRFYWLLPTLFWLEMALCIGIWWNRKGKPFQKTIVLFLSCMMLIPSLRLVLSTSYFYMSVNQLRNGSTITGYIPWESYYADDVMEEIEEAIGKEMSTYRVVHVGMNPTPALMHGFYTLDGYCNSYRLEYKHNFRKIMDEEFKKVPETAAYFDNWGNRCYLFNSQSGTAFMLGKDVSVKYEKLEYDWLELQKLGAKYIFSAGEITDYKDCGLKFIGDFVSETSYWHVWVYEL